MIGQNSEYRSPFQSYQATATFAADQQLQQSAKAKSHSTFTHHFCMASPMAGCAHMLYPSSVVEEDLHYCSE